MQVYPPRAIGQEVRVERAFVAAGGVLGAAGVAMSAVAAHALRGLDPASLQAVRSAVEMQLFHAIALVLCGIWAGRAAGKARALGVAAGLGLGAGTVLFCGAIYGRHLLALPVGAMAPVGGVTLILSWLALAASGAAFP